MHFKSHLTATAMPKRLHNIGVNETKVFVFNSVSEELVK
jgi:hypothetical protein